MSDTDNIAPQVEEPVATDNSEQVDTSDASTQTNEAPKATPTVEEKETAEIKAEDKAENRLYAGTFKDIQELEKGYTKLRSKYTQTASEKAELAKILNEAFQAPEISSQQEQEYYQEESPNQENTEIQQLKAQTTVMQFIMTHEDANADTMGTILNTDPIVKQIPDYNARLEYAYLKSKNMASSEAIADAQKKSTEQAQAKFAEKQAAQVETAKQQAQPTSNEVTLTKDELRQNLDNDEFFNTFISRKFPGIAQHRDAPR